MLSPSKPSLNLPSESALGLLVGGVTGLKATWESAVTLASKFPWSPMRRTSVVTSAEVPEKKDNCWLLSKVQGQKCLKRTRGGIMLVKPQPVVRSQPQLWAIPPSAVELCIWEVCDCLSEIRYQWEVDTIVTTRPLGPAGKPNLKPTDTYKPQIQTPVIVSFQGQRHHRVLSCFWNEYLLVNVPSL